MVVGGGGIKSMIIVQLKENMHHKHDVSSKDAFYVIDLAAGIYFGNFFIISKEAHFVPSLFLLICLTFPLPLCL